VALLNALELLQVLAQALLLKLPAAPCREALLQWLELPLRVLLPLEAAELLALPEAQLLPELQGQALELQLSLALREMLALPLQLPLTLTLRELQLLALPLPLSEPELLRLRLLL
jgi:hypothetical protein